MRVSRDRDIEQTSWREASRARLGGLLLLVKGGWGWQEGALGPLETLVALRGLAWSGGRMEPCRWPRRGDNTGASDGGQESHTAWGQPRD